MIQRNHIRHLRRNGTGKRIVPYFEGLQCSEFAHARRQRPLHVVVGEIHANDVLACAREPSF